MYTYVTVVFLRHTKHHLFIIMHTETLHTKQNATLHNFPTGTLFQQKKFWQAKIQVGLGVAPAMMLLGFSPKPKPGYVPEQNIFKY